ncbi:MAG: hypothetical protein NTW87_18965 [Planctomycetota bacterium]|nr:hypothetical protein [Planctomycetota bacterium]
MRLSYCSCVLPALLLTLALVAPGLRAESAAIEVQGVGATDAGKKEQTIPASLAQYKHLLKETLFGTFTDVGHQAVKPAAGGKDSAAIAGFTVEVTLVGVAGAKAKVQITIKQGGKPIGDPLASTLSKGEPLMISKVGSRDAQTILILTLKDTH